MYYCLLVSKFDNVDEFEVDMDVVEDYCRARAQGSCVLFVKDAFDDNYDNYNCDCDDELV